MEASKLAELLRKAAQHVTRRETLGALVGGALLVSGPAAIEATKKARRRKKRKRRAKGRIRPISILVDNTAGTQEVRVFRLEWIIGLCCFNQDTVTIPAGQTALFHSGLNEIGTRINEKYWFSFDNPSIGRPDVSVAVNGRPQGNYGCCEPRGTTIMRNTPMNVNQTIPVTINDLSFAVRRNADTNYKEFTVILPAVI